MANPEHTVIKQRPHHYSKDEKLAIATRIEETMDLLDELERERKQAALSFKNRMGDANETLEKLRANSKQGFEMRDHECFMRPNEETASMEFVDIKSGEVLDTRPFTSEDWQQTIMFAGPETGPDENKMRAEAGGQGDAIFPDVDTAGNIVPGPNTDAYNASLEDAGSTFDSVTTAGIDATRNHTESDGSDANAANTDAKTPNSDTNPDNTDTNTDTGGPADDAPSGDEPKKPRAANRKTPKGNTPKGDTPEGPKE